MQKGWSVFFGVVLLATLLIWFVAPFYGWWLPENVSTVGGSVDNLFYGILGITTFFFVLTEAVLVYGMWKFAARPGEKAVYSHGNHLLEVVWTVIPAAILLFIAIVQINVWEKIKYQSRMPSPDLTVSVLARQWEWRMRYPHQTDRFGYSAAEQVILKEELEREKKNWDDLEDKVKERMEQKAREEAPSRAHRLGRGWAENGDIDDVHATNELHAWKGANVKLWLRTLDVLHSFTLPNLRLKQDTLPGKTIPMWFQAEKSNCRFALVNRKTNRPVLIVIDEETKEIKVKDKEGDEPVALATRLAELKGELVESGNKKDAWEIACQELCGGRHYAMRGRLYVHEDKKSYFAWLHYSRGAQKARTAEVSMASGN